MKTDRLVSQSNVSRLVSKAQGTTNESGIKPIGTKVLVLTDQISETTKGGIYIPGENVERETMAVTRGTLVAVGGAAFTDWPNSNAQWPGDIPTVGQRVRLAKFCGIVVDGYDGKQYRLCQDVEITGVEV